VPESWPPVGSPRRWRAGRASWEARRRALKAEEILAAPEPVAETECKHQGRWKSRKAEQRIKISKGFFQTAAGFPALPRMIRRSPALTVLRKLPNEEPKADRGKGGTEKNWDRPAGKGARQLSRPGLTPEIQEAVGREVRPISLTPGRSMVAAPRKLWPQWPPGAGRENQLDRFLAQGSAQPARPTVGPVAEQQLLAAQRKQRKQALPDISGLRHHQQNRCRANAVQNHLGPPAGSRAWFSTPAPLRRLPGQFLEAGSSSVGWNLEVGRPPPAPHMRCGASSSTVCESSGWFKPRPFWSFRAPLRAPRAPHFTHLQNRLSCLSDQQGGAELSIPGVRPATRAPQRRRQSISRVISSRAACRVQTGQLRSPSAATVPHFPVNVRGGRRLRSPWRHLSLAGFCWSRT